MKRAWFRELLRRRLAVILLLLLQARFIVYAVHSDGMAAEVLRDLLRILSIGIVLQRSAAGAALPFHSCGLLRFHTSEKRLLSRSGQ